MGIVQALVVPGIRTASSLSLIHISGVGVLLPDELLPVPRAILTPQQILFAWTGFRCV